MTINKKAVAHFTKTILSEGISERDLAEVLCNRLEYKYPDVIAQYGHEVVADAVMGVASFHAGAEELGTSDIGIMLRQILRELEHGQHKIDESVDVATLTQRIVNTGRTKEEALRIIQTATKRSRIPAGSPGAAAELLSRIGRMLHAPRGQEEQQLDEILIPPKFKSDPNYEAWAEKRKKIELLQRDPRVAKDRNLVLAVMKRKAAHDKEGQEKGYAMAESRDLPGYDDWLTKDLPDDDDFNGECPECGKYVGKDAKSCRYCGDGQEDKYDDEIDEAKKVPFVPTKYPDTIAGVKAFVLDGKEMDRRYAKELNIGGPHTKIIQDPSVEGVWAVKNYETGEMVIIYMGGYRNPWGQIRGPMNDFESGEIPSRDLQHYREFHDLDQPVDENLDGDYSDDALADEWDMPNFPKKSGEKNPFNSDDEDYTDRQMRKGEMGIVDEVKPNRSYMTGGPDDPNVKAALAAANTRDAKLAKLAQTPIDCAWDHDSYGPAEWDKALTYDDLQRLGNEYGGFSEIIDIVDTEPTTAIIDGKKVAAVTVGVYMSYDLDDFGYDDETKASMGGENASDMISVTIARSPKNPKKFIFAGFANPGLHESKKLSESALTVDTARALIRYGDHIKNEMFKKIGKFFSAGQFDYGLRLIKQLPPEERATAMKIINRTGGMYGTKIGGLIKESLRSSIFTGIRHANKFNGRKNK